MIEQQLGFRYAATEQTIIQNVPFTKHIYVITLITYYLTSLTTALHRILLLAAVLLYCFTGQKYLLFEKFT